MKAKSFFFFLLATAFFSFGQESNTTFGIKGGLNYSMYTTDDLEIDGISIADYRFKAGYLFGAYINFPIQEKLSIQPELLFSLHGSSTLLENINIIDQFGSPIGVVREYKSNINESTILLPIIFQYNVAEKFYIEAGPQIGYIFKTKEKIDSSTTSEVENFLGVELEDAEFEDFDTIDVGLNIGLGYRVGDRINADLRYFFSINERNDRIKSSIFSLALQYKLF